MKLKFLLLFLFVIGYGALVNAQTKPYKNLIITEARFTYVPDNYVELTNMGNETVDLSEFELGSIIYWNTPWNPEEGRYLMLPKKMLAPGKSFLIANGYEANPKMWLIDPLNFQERITKIEFWTLADMILHQSEGNSTVGDSITPNRRTLAAWDGYGNCLYLRHHFIRDTDGLKDSMIVDQVGGVFDSPTGQNYGKAYDVAGVKNATETTVLIRKNSIKTGLSEFSSTEANAEAAKSSFNLGRGLDLKDSEWIPVPYLGGMGDSWRAVFWTAGNQVDAKLDENTLVSKSGKVKVDLDKATITVPWGVRNDDSLMFQFQRKPGLAWHYDYAPTTEDSAYISARSGDVLTIYVCGNEATIKKFTIIVNDPTPSDNIVIPKNWYDYKRMRAGTGAYNDIHVTDGVSGMDSISRVEFATRVDTLFRYLEKAPKASWKIIPKSGVERPEIANGDLLRVTSENGKVKDYFIKVHNYVASENKFLSSITWPDIPDYFKGDIAKSFGWAGDTIPGFSPSIYSYIVKIPNGYGGIPALNFTRQQLSSRVVVNRAKSLNGSAADRTVTFTVTAENNTDVNVYTVVFEKDKDPLTIQPLKAEPYISRLVWGDGYGSGSWVEFYNPGTEPLDMSNYMVMAGYGGTATVFNLFNTADTWGNAYRKYVPGRKWQDEANWAVQPRILETDLAVNPIVYPHDVFVLSSLPGDQATWELYGKQADVNLRGGMNPWGFNVGLGNAAMTWSNGTYFLLKITNDSVKSGLKPVTDIRDFKLIDVFGNGPEQVDWVFEGIPLAINTPTSYTRKPNIYKGNTEFNGSFGTTTVPSEWIMTDMFYYIALKYPAPEEYFVPSGIGSHIMNDVTYYLSTVTSNKYKVSPGYSKKETIKGITTGTTVTGFYNNLVKADEKQTLKVKSVTTGLELALTAAVSKGDSLIVLSADSVNTSKYILDVTANGLSADALLTSATYTINATGATGTITGFEQGTLLKQIVAGVVVPTGATLTLTDQNDAYMTLTKLNYDSAYVNVIATDNVYFEVVAENGTTKILYQLMPNSNPNDAYLTSDVYSVDQSASLVQFVPTGTTVQSLLSSVYPAPGATVVVYDKAGFVRDLGSIYRDDKLVVTSKDGTTTKVYYLSMLNFKVNTYLAYVTSTVYKVDQLGLTIKLPTTTAALAEFYSKLNPSYGASLMVIDKNGNPSGNSLVSVGDRLQVIAADNVTTTIYEIGTTVGVSSLDNNEMIKMYPNPTTDRVVINGLAKGNRVRVFNATGVTLRDVTVNNSTEYVSLAAQPAGIYVFVISSGEKFINIQKIIKK